MPTTSRPLSAAGHAALWMSDGAANPARSISRLTLAGSCASSNVRTGGGQPTLNRTLCSASHSSATPPPKLADGAGGGRLRGCGGGGSCGNGGGGGGSGISAGDAAAGSYTGGACCDAPGGAASSSPPRRECLRRLCPPLSSSAEDRLRFWSCFLCFFFFSLWRSRLRSLRSRLRSLRSRRRLRLSSESSLLEELEPLDERDDMIHVVPWSTY